jgi:hypothetical protein
VSSWRTGCPELNLRSTAHRTKNAKKTSVPEFKKTPEGPVVDISVPRIGGFCTATCPITNWLR